VKPGRFPRVALAVAVVAVGAGAGWVAFGSAATLSVTPKNHTAFRTCVLTPYPKASTVEFDSWVDQNGPNANKAGVTTIQVQSKAGSRNLRGFLRFDLTKCSPTIAGAATVRTASLRLTLSAASGTRTYNINRVTGPCPEGATTCWSESGLTWSNQPTVAAGATSTLSLSSASTTNTYYAFDVTADVAAIVAGTASNYGWRIADSVEDASGTNSVNFYSKDQNAAARAPELVIVYSP
jgi:hypothetical protein